MKLASHITHHLTGEHHTVIHRRVTGFLVMGFGVGISKGALLLDSTTIHFIGDLVGYAIHALGFVPFASAFEKH